MPSSRTQDRVQTNSPATCVDNLGTSLGTALTLLCIQHPTKEVFGTGKWMSSKGQPVWCRVINGQERKWCAKCYGGKGAWSLTHSTGEHTGAPRPRFNKQAGGNQQQQQQQWRKRPRQEPKPTQVQSSITQQAERRTEDSPTTKGETQEGQGDQGIKEEAPPAQQAHPGEVTLP